MASHLQLARSPEDRDAEVANAHVRVLLADDHVLMRRSLRMLLDGEDGVDVIAEANDMAAVTRHVMGHGPHVLVLDLSMPGGSSIEAISRLREQAPGTKIVVMTMEENPVFAQRAFAAG
jgi:two-component system response regulator NreC